MTIESTEILLRPFTLKDVNDFCQIAHDNQVKEFVPYAYVASKRAAKKLISNYMTYDFVNDFYFAICRPDDGKLIGMLLAYRLPNTKILETEYFIGKDYRGKGYMEKALRLFIEYTTSSTDYDALRFVVSPYNISSMIIMYNLGLADNGDEMIYFYPLKHD